MKFRFAVSSVVSDDNINLAFLENLKFTSNDSVKVTKYTNLYDDNIIPIFADATKSIVRSGGVVDIFNSTDEILVTNDTIIDDETMDVVPLWYMHNLKKVYMNITKNTRDIQVTIEGNTIDNLIPTGSSSTIVKNSVTVYYSVLGAAPSNVLATNRYKVDVANDRVVITHEDTLTLSQGLYRVVYDVIVPDIIIEDKHGDIVSSSKYVVEANAISGSDVLFNTNILTWFSNSEEDTYYIKYSTLEATEQVEVSDILRVYPMYNRVEDTSMIFDRNDRKYALSSNYDILTKLTEYDTVYLKYTIENNEYIELKAPDSLPHNTAWYVDVRAGLFVYSDTGLTYDILERNKYIIKNGQRISNAVVDPVFISDKIVKLYHKNLYVNVDNTGSYTNLHLYVDGVDRMSMIDDVDTYNGILYLNDVISTKKDVSVSYYYRTKYIPYEYINANPLSKYKDNEDIILKYIVMYMLPKEYLDLSKNRSVFHRLVYKYPGSIKNIIPREINISKCVTYILGTDDSGISNIHDEVAYYLSDSAPDNLEPKILGIVSTSNIIHPSSYDFFDIRTHAQYLSDIYDLGEILDINSDILNYSDIGRYDGEAIYIDKVVVVNVPIRLQEKIQTLFATFDTDTIRRTKYDSDYPTEKMKEYITYVVKKYFKVGLYFKITFEE